MTTFRMEASLACVERLICRTPPLVVYRNRPCDFFLLSTLVGTSNSKLRNTAQFYTTDSCDLFIYRVCLSNPIPLSTKALFYVYRRRPPVYFGVVVLSSTTTHHFASARL